MIQELFKNNELELFIQFSKREFLARYKQSFIGIGWAVIQPLVLMVIFTIVFGKFAKIPSDGIPYPIFSYTALLPWTLLASGINYGVNSLTSNVSLITKVYFPREVIPLASILVATIDFFVASTIFVGLILWYNITFSFNFLMIIPLVILQLIVIVTIVLVLSVWNVRYRDVRHGLPFVIQVWMYASPVVYPLSVVPEEWEPFYVMNPMVGIIDGYRALILRGEALDIITLFPALIFAFVGLPFAYIYFKKAEKSFADII
ncbi:MAG: ABC transporter permease [Thermodesulfobacteriota bacterium]|nr:ABC transporter permease [Thermodesulfobacteriota bacterium]